MPLLCVFCHLSGLQKSHAFIFNLTYRDHMELKFILSNWGNDSWVVEQRQQRLWNNQSI